MWQMECTYVVIDAVFGGKDAKVVNMKSIFSYDFVDYAHCMNYYSFYIFCSKIVLLGCPYGYSVLCIWQYEP